jgi:hypothetical protein
MCHVQNYHYSSQKVRENLERAREALKQNPGFEIIYEFPDEGSRRIAQDFIRENRYDKIVKTRVRGE